MNNNDKIINYEKSIQSISELLSNSLLQITDICEKTEYIITHINVIDSLTKNIEKLSPKGKIAFLAVIYDTLKKCEDLYNQQGLNRGGK